MLKNKLGITLIALVITIIILLILAGVSINFMFGNDGIIGKAQSAVEKYRNAQNEEQSQISKVTNEIDSYVDGNRDYQLINYSTNEQDTGIKWIDGKTIYQKTILVNKTVNSGWNEISGTGITNIDTAIKFIVLGSQTSTISELEEFHFSESQLQNDDCIAFNNASGVPNNRVIRIITIQYTKK